MHQFEEELKLFFVRQRDTGISSFRPFVRTLYTQRGVLSELEPELTARDSTNHPEIRGNIYALDDLRLIELLIDSVYMELNC
jgi:hypothetical protein